MPLQKFFDSCNNYCKPSNAVSFNWSAKGTGFGEFYFYEKDGKLMCSNELKSKEFIKLMLCKMVDDCTLDDPRDEKSS